MKHVKLLFWLTIIFMILTIAIVSLHIVLFATGYLESSYPARITLGFTSPTIVGIFFIITFNYLINRSFYKTNLIENKYNFGHERNFYNYSSFERAVRLRKLRKKGQQYLISFSACDYNTMKNSSRNDAIMLYSNEIASSLTKIIRREKNEYKMDNFIYCYYHGVFLIYMWGDDSKVRQIIMDVERELYEIPERNNLRVFVQPFFGVYPLDKNKKEDLYVSVDNANMARNQSEKNFESITYYNPSLRKSSSIEEVEEISQALKDGEFVVYYQPKYHLTTHRFISSEALIRWDSKKYGLLDPGKFIQKAENGGLIHELDMFVFRKVCEDLNETKRKGRRLIPVSVNFSLYEFYSPNFIDDLFEIIEENKVASSLVEIEVTESTSQSNPFVSISIMKKLREKGLKILMDDFGVGFSNFKNLKKMPIDTIKIDKSFIDEIVIDPKSREIVKFLISLCKVNGLEVVAEGVDNKEQVDILKKFKCDTIQGFYYSKPLSKAEYEKFLASNEFEKKEAY